MSIEKTEFAIAKVYPGQLNAMVKKIMVQIGTNDPNEVVRMINSGEVIANRPERSWHQEGEIIYLSVTSDGTTGLEWERWYDNNSYQLSKEARFLLNSPDFKPTKGVTTRIAIPRGTLWEDDKRHTKNIRSLAQQLKWETPNPEIACLIRRKLSNREIEEMELIWIIIMHDPINNSVGGPCLLGMYRDADVPWLRTCYDVPLLGWRREVGFAFAIPQVSP